MSVANDRQVGGEHYRAVAGEQHWDRAVRLEFDFFQYMITKYVERCWKKNGTQDLEKAMHFCQKYIEVARMRGLRGDNEAIEVDVTNIPPTPSDSAEAALENAKVIDYLMSEVIITATGMYEMPDGTKYTCVKGGPTDFTWEGGYGDGRTLWTCNTCRNKVTTKGAQLPQRAHQCLGFDRDRPRGHAHDAETKEICKRCDQRAVPLVCTQAQCPHQHGVDPVHVYDKDGRDKALFASRTSA